MKQLVIQQLGHKSDYDSTLNGLDIAMNGPGGDGVLANEMKMTQNLTGPKASGEKPLENLIRDALAYDSVKYREALGINS